MLIFMSISIGRIAAAQEKAALQGKVFAEGIMRPISGAEVTIAELGKSTIANDKGAFSIVDITPGIYTVRVRSIGFARFESRIEFYAGKKEERAIVLPAVAPLDTLKVVGEVGVPLSFLEHKAAGMGHFLTREELASRDGQRLPNVLSQFPGLGIVRGRSTQSWIMSKRFAVPLSASKTGGNKTVYAPSADERMRGVVTGCYARVYLDNLLLNSSSPAEPVDLNEHLVNNIEAIEYYDGPSQTPSQYARLNSGCGILVIHTRRRP